MRSPGPRTPAGSRGLNDTGHIVREGSLDRIGAAFRAPGPYLARAAAQLAGPGADRPRLVRAAARKVARTGFTLVMPRWHGWTSDLDLAAEVFGRYYPDRADQMRQAVTLGRQPWSRAEPGRWEAGRVLLFHDLGPWLADEYTREIGVKHPRP